MNPVAWAVLIGLFFVFIQRGRNRRQLRILQREIARQRRRVGLKAVAVFLAIGAVAALLSHPKPATACAARPAAAQAASPSACPGGR